MTGRLNMSENERELQRQKEEMMKEFEELRTLKEQLQREMKQTMREREQLQKEKDQLHGRSPGQQDNGQCRAVQIAKTDNGKIRIEVDKIAQILEQVGDRPVAIVSVNGPMRTGKSYILNHFLRYLTCLGTNDDWFTKALEEEFHWKNSSDRQTIGILVWDTPFFVKRDGREIGVVLVDTQGFFDDQTTTSENSFLFSLSCLLSSVLVYNVPKQLAEDTLQFMQLFIYHARMAMDSEDTKAFSKLIFLVRDFQYPTDFRYGYHNDDSPVGGSGDRNFKVEKLNVHEEQPREVQVVHRSILDSFRVVDCCLLPHPGNALAIHDSVRLLEPEFEECIRDFVPRVFKSGQLVKEVGGRPVNGVELLKMVKQWAKEFSKYEGMPVRNLAEATAETQLTIAYTYAMKEYKDGMQRAVQEELSGEEFRSQHLDIQKSAFRVFQNFKRMKHPELESEYETQLKDDIEANYQLYQQIHEANWQRREKERRFQAQLTELQKELGNASERAQEEVLLRQKEREELETQHQRLSELKSQEFELEKQRWQQQLEKKKNCAIM